VAWAESNAIVFANSVLGARTNRYGDFIDICAAITGRAPDVGLHRTENRRGQLLFRLTGIPDRLLYEDVLFPVLGYYLGARTGTRIPVIDGLPPETTEDQLKAMGAAAASSGGVALFHVVGVTPEAPTLDAAFQGDRPAEIVDITLDNLRETLGVLSTAPDGRIDVVALGSPHFSLAEFAQLMPLIAKYPPNPDVEFIVCTHRIVLAMLEQRGWLHILRGAGVQVIVDTCVVVTPIVRARDGVLMTNSGKFAHYSPGNIGLQVVYGSLEECVRSGALGEVWRDERLWTVEVGSTTHRLHAATEPAASEWDVTRAPSRSEGYVLVSGAASGEALVLDAPLSLWGGLDPETGDIIDQRHPQWGANVTGKLLVMPIGKGSSSASSILLESVRLGTAPAAILLAEPDAILALGSAVARELYGGSPPVVVLDGVTYGGIQDGQQVELTAEGAVIIQ
jgi:predicted aconitase with swiveling domain